MVEHTENDERSEIATSRLTLASYNSDRYIHITAASDLDDVATELGFERWAVDVGCPPADGRRLALHFLGHLGLPRPSVPVTAETVELQKALQKAEAALRALRKKAIRAELAGDALGRAIVHCVDIALKPPSDVEAGAIPRGISRRFDEYGMPRSLGQMFARFTSLPGRPGKPRSAARICTAALMRGWQMTFGDAPAGRTMTQFTNLLSQLLRDNEPDSKQVRSEVKAARLSKGPRNVRSASK